MGMITYQGKSGDDRTAGLTVNRLWMNIPMLSGKIAVGRMRIDPKAKDEFNNKQIDFILWFTDEPITDELTPEIYAQMKMPEHAFIKAIKDLRSASGWLIGTAHASLTGVDQFTGEQRVLSIVHPGAGQLIISLKGKSIIIDRDYFNRGLDNLFSKEELK